MKKFLFGFFVTAFLLFINTVTVNASVNDFVIRDFQADYYLNVDNENRSTLKTVEIITADFPNIDQNHGIERAIPKSYDGHSVSLDVQSVTDQNGANLSYSTYDSNDNLVLRIGSADTYVHGINTYKITYNQRDVTRFFKDTNDDEFYWDINGTDWLQSFDNVTARLHIGQGLTGSLTGKQSCYSGISGSSTTCDISKIGDTFSVNMLKLRPRENITIAVGFKPHTFAEYKMSQSEITAMIFAFVYFAMGVVLLVVTLVLLIVMFRLKITKGKGAPGRGTIIAEYLPPKNADVALSSVIIGKERTWTSAMYIDLAVRHKVKIIERKEGFFKRTAYSLELISREGLTDTESAVISALFNDNGEPGDRHDFPLNKFDSRLSTILKFIYKKSKNTAKADGYYEDDKQLKKKMTKILVAIVIMTIFTTVFGVFAIIIGAIILTSTKPLTQKGRELLDYLKGLELYIKVAEEDRIKILQSPKGAEKIPIDVNNHEELIHLYEKVLPYAVLFGNEKEWAKRLGYFYQERGSSPDWYVGNNTFNAVLFSSALSNFSSTTINNSYSSPSNSSSGGSGGGGFSGGGGGGGGGGGW